MAAADYVLHPERATCTSNSPRMGPIWDHFHQRDLQLEARALSVKQRPGSVSRVRVPALAVRSMAWPWNSPRTPEPGTPQLHKPATNSLSAILPSPEAKPTLICQSRPIPSHNLSNVTLCSCCYAVRVYVGHDAHRPASLRPGTQHLALRPALYNLTATLPSVLVLYVYRHARHTLYFTGSTRPGPRSARC